jgi:predicted dehydrogenase
MTPTGQGSIGEGVIRWGIIGCGDVANRRAADAIRIHPHSKIVAACRRNEGKLGEFCAHFGVNRAYTDAEALLDDPGVDAVYIATPVHLHRPQAVDAARRGKHVLLEKPMALSVAGCDEIIAACRDHGVKLGLVYYRRFYPAIGRLKELLAEGAIGKTVAVSATTATAPMPPDCEGYWRMRPAQSGGGSLIDIGSHRLDLFLDLFGLPTDVRPLCDTTRGPYKVEDSASLLLRFEGAVHGALRCFFGVSNAPDEFSVIGTEGSIDVTPLNSGRLVLRTSDGERSEQLPPADNFNAPVIADFVDAILQDHEPLCTGPQGRAVNEVIEVAYRDAT